MTEAHVLIGGLGAMRAPVDLALAHLEGKQVIRRLWERDHSVWKPTPEGIEGRLGWLDTPQRMLSEIHTFETLAMDAREAGYTQALLLGMGEWSLAPECFRRTFGVAEGFLDLHVVGTTDPATLREWTERIDPERTLWLVAIDTGGTFETLSLLKHFFGHASSQLGEVPAGQHFVAMTENGNQLAQLASEWSFRKITIVDPGIGGRYSALSPYGLIPAALIGLDLRRLLERARAMAALCGPDVPIGENPGAKLGVVLGELARAGRDKLTLVLPDDELGRSLGEWIEQLLAESTGKEGRGILPVVGEPFGPPSAYGPDRLFVCFDREGSSSLVGNCEKLTSTGHPLIRLSLSDPYDLGGQLFLWQFATAVAGHQLQINPFDQPDVEAAETTTLTMLETFKEQGELPLVAPTLADGVLSVYGDVTAATPVEAFTSFLSRTRPPEYLAMLSFLQPTEATERLLTELRTRLLNELGVPVTLGAGPQFLHSTGQIHKGDAGHGRFLQITAQDHQDIPIPDEMGFQQGVISFGVLKRAQAMGDFQALLEAGRKVLRVDLGDDVVTGLTVLIHAFDPHRTSSIPPM